MSYAENARQPGEISPSEAAQLVGVHQDTVIRWAKDGRLDSRRDACGRFWVRQADVQAFLAALLRGNDAR